MSAVRKTAINKTPQHSATPATTAHFPNGKCTVQDRNTCLPYGKRLTGIETGAFRSERELLQKNNPTSVRKSDFAKKSARFPYGNRLAEKNKPDFRTEVVCFKTNLSDFSTEVELSEVSYQGFRTEIELSEIANPDFCTEINLLFKK